MRKGDRVLLDLSPYILEHLQYTVERAMVSNGKMSYKEATVRARTLLLSISEQIIDDILSDGMEWVSEGGSCFSEKYLKMVTFSNSEEMLGVIDCLIEDLSGAVEGNLQLPTWFMLRATPVGRHIQIEVGEDFRIHDWMERYKQRVRRRPRKTFLEDEFFINQYDNGGYRR